MKKLVFVTLLSFSLFSCHGQKKVDKIVSNLDTIKPKTNIVVHKEYDENGNLIRLDSTYSYFYSNIKNDSLLEKQIFEDFKMDFNKKFPIINDTFLQQFFKKDPFQMQNFYTDDFFENNKKNHQETMMKMLKQMDSLKNSFYLDQKNILRKKEDN